MMPYNNSLKTSVLFNLTVLSMVSLQVTYREPGAPTQFPSVFYQHCLPHSQLLFLH